MWPFLHQGTRLGGRVMEKATLAAMYDTHRDEFLAALRQVMAVKSVRGQQAEHAPFGSGPRAVLTAVAQLGAAYGFKTAVVNDAMAYVQWGEDDQHYIGIVGHLDVVPAGDADWHFPPYALSEKDGRLYGRGVLDNKGPSMACLIGMKLLKDAGFQPQKTIRLIFGSDEESGSNDVPRYLASEAPPEFGFTPDCKFPVVYGERGIVNYRITTPIATTSIKQIGTIAGDQTRDHVPDKLTVAVDGQPITANGIRVPTNAPEKGVNAITELAKKLVTEQRTTGELASYCQWLIDSLAEKHFGEGLGMAFEDDDSGRLIMTPYSLQKTDDAMTLGLAMRYPVTYHEANVSKGLAAAVPAGSQITIVRSMPSVLHDRHDPRIAQLTQAYEKMTGNDGTPVTTTGATYAREMPNIIAFGPSFPGQKGIAHKEDEWMDEADLKLNMMIFMDAMIGLTERDPTRLETGA